MHDQFPVDNRIENVSVVGQENYEHARNNPWGAGMLALAAATGTVVSAAETTDHYTLSSLTDGLIMLTMVSGVNLADKVRAMRKINKDIE